MINFVATVTNLSFIIAPPATSRGVGEVEIVQGRVVLTLHPRADEVSVDWSQLESKINSFVGEPRS